MKDDIDALIARNKAAHVTRDGRGRAEWATPDRDRINRMGRQRFDEVVAGREACARAERLARRLGERRLKAV